MKKILLVLMFAIACFGCTKTQRPASLSIPETQKEHGYVVYNSQGGEWQLIDSSGKRLVPLNLSPALKVHRLRVYFTYEKIAFREDGLPLVKIVSIAIE